MDRLRVGFAVSSVGGVLGTAFTLLVFVSVYGTQVETELARGAPIEALLVSFVLPALAVLGMAGGILWFVSAYGFAVRKEWSFIAAAVGCVFSILAGFFPILPFVSSGLGFPPTAILFGVNLLFFLILGAYVHPIGRGALAFSLLTGMAYVLAFVNGVASTHYILAGAGSYFVALEPLNFIASVAWGLATVSVLLRKAWVEPLTIGAAAASAMGGIPLALLTQMELGRPSLFWPSPVLALIILAIVALGIYGPTADT